MLGDDRLFMVIPHAGRDNEGDGEMDSRLTADIYRCQDQMWDVGGGLPQWDTQLTPAMISK